MHGRELSKKAKRRRFIVSLIGQAAAAVFAVGCLCLFCVMVGAIFQLLGVQAV